MLSVSVTVKIFLPGVAYEEGINGSSKGAIKIIKKPGKVINLQEEIDSK